MSHSTRRDFLRTATLAGAAALTGAGCERKDDSVEDAIAEVRSAEPEARNTEIRQVNVSEALFRPTKDGVTLHWVADSAHEARINSGASQAELQPLRSFTSPRISSYNLKEQPIDKPFFVRVDYRASADAPWQPGALRRVQPQRSPGQSFKVAILADTHTHATINKPGAAAAAKATAKACIRDEVDFVVFIGDEATLIRDIYKGRRVDKNVVRQAWTQWRELYKDLLAQVPSYLVLGNHEGEAGYYQSYRSPAGPPLHLQRVATIGRKQFVLNPLPTTYPEGGEDEGWVGDQASMATGGASEGNCSPLENYYAWNWGDALFVVLDVHRYTNPGGKTPSTPEQWTLGEAQMKWLEGVLRNSEQPWKVILCHHLVGGWPYDGSGRTKDTKYCYGRGGGRYARVGEQAKLNDLMKETGTRFFLYGHDHVFAHQPADDIEFVCCGRPSYLNPDWFKRPAWPEAYGSAKDKDFIAALGYTRLTVSPEELVLDYVRAAEDPGKAENVDTPVGASAYQKRFTLG